jgi:uncharacterized protein
MLTGLGIVVLVLGLLSIPLGLPGLWIMVGVVALGAIMGEVGMLILLATVLLAIVAEVIEFFIVRKLTAQYGGSRKAFWGALAGGFVGVIVGMPVPIIGSLIAGMLGSFIGAAVVTYTETQKLTSAHRAGWGALLGRMISAVAKTAAGVAILVLAAAALLR